ncbi:XkdX family protein [Lactiplantibacillus plantarum]|uniref:XkdX family protein n=1 Tax=Lactiplantibacillus plantarum TaxID=1590 RepID=UPI000B418128|nr:XkdX family protein [Lactiplantibacillus plantarum]
MMVVFKFAYQLWHTMDKTEVAAEVTKGSITADDYKTITGEDYVAQAKVDGGDHGEIQK